MNLEVAFSRARDVTDDYTVKLGALQGDELYRVLCGERDFSRGRVDLVVNRMRRFHGQRTLRDWLAGAA